MDRVVRRIQQQLPSLIVSGLSLYFAAVFLIGGGKTLFALQEGTTDYVAQSLTQGLGYAFGPMFANVILVAAAIGAAKLAVGGYFILAVTERSPAAMNGVRQKEYGALDLALHGAVALTIFQVIPAWIVGDELAVRKHTADVLLLCVAVGTSMFERENAARPETRVSELEETAGYQPDPDRPLPTGRAPLR